MNSTSPTQEVVELINNQNVSAHELFSAIRNTVSGTVPKGTVVVGCRALPKTTCAEWQSKDEPVYFLFAHAVSAASGKKIHETTILTAFAHLQVLMVEDAENNNQRGWVALFLILVRSHVLANHNVSNEVYSAISMVAQAVQKTLGGDVGIINPFQMYLAVCVARQDSGKEGVHVSSKIRLGPQELVASLVESYPYASRVHPDHGVTATDLALGLPCVAAVLLSAVVSGSQGEGVDVEGVCKMARWCAMTALPLSSKLDKPVLFRFAFRVNALATAFCERHGRLEFPVVDPISLAGVNDSLRNSGGARMNVQKLTAASASVVADVLVSAVNSILTGTPGFDVNEPLVNIMDPSKSASVSMVNAMENMAGSMEEGEHGEDAIWGGQMDASEERKKPKNSDDAAEMNATPVFPFLLHIFEGVLAMARLRRLYRFAAGCSSATLSWVCTAVGATEEEVRAGLSLMGSSPAFPFSPSVSTPEGATEECVFFEDSPVKADVVLIRDLAVKAALLGEASNKVKEALISDETTALGAAIAHTRSKMGGGRGGGAPAAGMSFMGIA